MGTTGSNLIQTRVPSFEVWTFRDINTLEHSHMNVTVGLDFVWGLLKTRAFNIWNTPNANWIENYVNEEYWNTVGMAGGDMNINFIEAFLGDLIQVSKFVQKWKKCIGLWPMCKKFISSLCGQTKLNFLELACPQ